MKLYSKTWIGELIERACLEPTWVYLNSETIREAEKEYKELTAVTKHRPQRNRMGSNKLV